jgi:hypothetical protein
MKLQVNNRNKLNQKMDRSNVIFQEKKLKNQIHQKMDKMQPDLIH